MSLALAGLLAGCGRAAPPPANFVDLANQVQAQLCHAGIACGGIEASEGPSCEPDAVRIVRLIGQAAQLDAEVAAGRLAFDAVAAQDCLDLIRSLGRCVDPSLRDLLQGRCGDAMVPRVPVGGACYLTPMALAIGYDDHATECIGGYCARANTPDCMGVCQAFSPVGAACDHCAPDDECGDSSTCQSWGLEGEPCTGGCAFGFFCHHSGPGLATCAPTAPIGGDCTPGTIDSPVGDACTPGSICHVVSASPLVATCVDPIGLGEFGSTCTFDEDCAGGLLCIDSVCRPPLDAGDPCTPGSYGCPGGLAACDSVSKTCAEQIKRPGDPCPCNGDLDLYCDASSHCVSKSALGEACDPSVPSCFTGACDANLRTCILRCDQL